MKNYKPILLDANWPDVVAKVSDASLTITYRSYVNGSSRDEKRNANALEHVALESVMLGALQAIKWRDDAAQTALDTAEFTIDYLLHGVNGYDSVYLPLMRILRELDPETKEENA